MRFRVLVCTVGVLSLTVFLTSLRVVASHAPAARADDPVPATYTQRAHLATDAGFVGRVGIAAVAGALAVVAEDPETADHVQRARLAAFVLREPEFVARKLSLLIAATAPVVDSEGTVQLALTDEQLQAAVAARWTLLAETLVGGGQ